MLTIFDIYYRGSFSSTALLWNFLPTCKLLASLNNIASEVSLSILVYISFFRAYSISKVWSKLSDRFTAIVCSSCWVFWISYSAVTAFLLGEYGIPVESNVCILVFFTNVLDNAVTTIHSAIFTTINSLKLILLIVCYCSIAYNVARKRRNMASVSASKSSNRNYNAMVFKLSLLCFSNVSCWIPLLVSAILSLLGIQLPKEVSVWMTIFVIPINASFCPIMYCLLPIIREKLNKR